MTRERGIAFHVDAVCAFGKVPVRVDEVPCDLLNSNADQFTDAQHADSPVIIGGGFGRHVPAVLDLARGRRRLRGEQESNRLDIRSGALHVRAGPVIPEPVVRPHVSV